MRRPPNEPNALCTWHIRADRHLYGHLNPRSGSLRRKCWPELIAAEPEDVFQFERIGYFCVDAKK